MSEIESPSTPVIALFDSERNADQALSTLASRELNQEAIKVVDKPDLADAEEAPPYPAYLAGASLGPMRPDPESASSTDIAPGAAQDEMEELEQVLRGLNISTAEARYYASGVYEGGTLIIVNASGETAKEVLEILRAAGASNYNP